MMVMELKTIDPDQILTYYVNIYINPDSFKVESVLCTTWDGLLLNYVFYLLVCQTL